MELHKLNKLTLDIVNIILSYTNSCKECGVIDKIRKYSFMYNGIRKCMLCKKYVCYNCCDFKFCDTCRPCITSYRGIGGLLFMDELNYRLIKYGFIDSDGNKLKKLDKCIKKEIKEEVNFVLRIKYGI